MNIFISAAVVSALIYLLICFFLSRGLKKITCPEIDSADSGYRPFVSVIVAARNEEKNIPSLLSSLKAQTYPSSHFSITVVNDRSTDTTESVIQEWMGSLSNLSCVTVTDVPAGVAPKKNAVSQGIKSSSGEIVVFTDADCVVSPHWIETITAHFADPHIGLVQGLTRYPSSYSSVSLFHRLQRIDFFSHSVVAAAGIGVNIPINSNANNFAFRRQVFDELQGYDGISHVVSGDDDLFLQRVWSDGRWKISYLYTPDAVVETEPAMTLGEMFEQRKRWGSKTVHYKPVQVVVLSGIFLFYCVVASMTVLTMVKLFLLPMLLLLYGCKLIGELFFLIPGTRVFGEKMMRKDIFWASPVQLYLVLFSIFSGVFGGFTWKGQKFRKTVSTVEE